MNDEQNRTNCDISPKPSGIDFAIVRELISDPSATDMDIAQKVGVSRQTINRRRNSTGVKSVLAEGWKVSGEDVRRLVGKALNRLELALDSPDERIAIVAATQLIKLAPEARNHTREEFDFDF